MKYQFYAKPAYYETLIKEIGAAKKGDRVALATMSFWPHVPAVKQLMACLCRAAQRGVEVRLMVDAWAFLVHKHVAPGPLVFRRSLPSRAHLPKIHRQRLEALEQLKASGGTYGVINWPTRILTSPFVGRSHVKCAVINDHVFVGGCNLNDPDDIDLMVGWHDHHHADSLFTFVSDAIENGSVKGLLKDVDQTAPLDANTTLCIDAGVAKQSTIFDSALQLIDSAKEYAVLTCQYFPNDVTIEHLAQAEARGVTVKIIYNHPAKHTLPFNVLHQSIAAKQRRLRPTSFFAYQLPKTADFIHAKLLVTDQGTMIGSHNYVKAGVDFGTAEIALLSHDPTFGKAALRALQAQLPDEIHL